MNDKLLNIAEPVDYFKGKGSVRLPTPVNILSFIRTDKRKLQQEALQNRSHHRFVLCFNLETQGHIHVDNLSLAFKPGQALMILPYQFHHFSLMTCTTLQWLFFTFELEPRTFLEPLRNRVIDTSEKTNHAITELLKEWHCPSSELQAEQLQTLLMHLLLSLKEDRRESAPDLPPEPEDNLLRIINTFLAERTDSPVVVADIARALNYSASRLRVLFKEAAGIPLGAYIQNYRINRAMALLRTTDRSISNIAEEAGFGSPQAFSRIFKQECGQTPRDYRAQ
jgi:AraC-like DNA-binding protein